MSGNGKKDKPSGSFYCKRKKEEAKEDQKQAKAMKQFLITAETSSAKIGNVSKETGDGASDKVEIEARIPSGLGSDLNVDDGPTTSTTESKSCPFENKETDRTESQCSGVESDFIEISSFECESDKAPKNTGTESPRIDTSSSGASEFTESAQLVEWSDCGEWPGVISEQIRLMLVSRGPSQIQDFDFPVTSYGRKFTTACYFWKLSNGEKINRNWLVYSVSNDSVHCFCCKLFSKKDISLTSKNGFSDWRNIHGFLSNHKKSKAHFQATQDWQELVTRLKTGKTIDHENQRVIDRETDHWTEVLKRLLTIIQFLGTQGLALRGTSACVLKKNNGNFLQLVEHIARFDPFLSEHLRRVSSKETNVHYLSPEIQNELITLISSNVLNKIVENLKEAIYYSIILDCTPDVSHTEQMTMIVRFVEVNEGKGAKIREHFLGFVPIEDTTGEGLTDSFLTELAKLDIPLVNMRGQGYDNGSNMKGKNKGVQNRILELNPRAFYVPRGNHSLNLVVNDAALSCVDAVSFFGIVQEIYNFFFRPTYRWSLLLKHITSLTVKALSETRWESRIEALTPLRYQLGEIYDALYEASEDKKFDAFGRNQALSLALKILNFKFVCSLVTWYDILFKINIVSKLLQQVSFDLKSAIDVIESVKNYLVCMRSDHGLASIITDAKEVAETLDLTPKFETEKRVRPRRVKRQFDCESASEPVATGLTAFRTNFFFVILDTAISSLEERFKLLKSHSKNFSFLYDINDYVQTANEAEVLEKCMNLQKILTDEASCDIDGQEMAQELIILAPTLPAGSTPKEVLNHLIKKHLMCVFPNVFVSLRILLTLPISVASAERSFSKLKLIKTSLRSAIGQERLSGLAVMSIEAEILKMIDTQTIIRDFAVSKAQKVRFDRGD